MARSGSYLAQRPGSAFWYVQLRLPPTVPVELIPDGYGKNRTLMKSLGTMDRDEAELIAARYVQVHKALLLYWRKVAFRNTAPALTRKWKPNQTHERDGETFLATEDQLLFLDNGRVYRTEPNPFDDRVVIDGLERVDLPVLDAFEVKAKVPENLRPAPKTNPDDALIEDYIRFKPLKPRIADEARWTWNLYKERIGKPIAKATKKDGRELADILFADGLKRATVQKKVGWLSAAVNHAMKEGETKIAVNPFAGILPPRAKGDSDHYRPFTEEHMAALWKALPTLSTSDQLLWRVLAKTGMRLGEAMSLRAEDMERGCTIRRVFVGSKTDSSERYLPLPPDVGLPKKINAKLFPGTAGQASKRLNRFIKSVIPDADKQNLVVHSHRHRVADVLRALHIGDHYARRFLGHASPDVHGQYGSSVPLEISLEVMANNPIDGTFIKRGLAGVRKPD